MPGDSERDMSRQREVDIRQATSKIQGRNRERSPRLPYLLTAIKQGD
jgi:hypothetical protein